MYILFCVNKTKSCAKCFEKREQFVLPFIVNGSAEDAQFKKPLGICIDNDDVMYIGDSENRAIRRLAVE